MARFIGRVQGNRGSETRLGTQNSGIDVSAMGWEAGVFVKGFVNDDGFDEFHVYVNHGSNNAEHALHIATVMQMRNGIKIKYPEDK